MEPTMIPQTQTQILFEPGSTHIPDEHAAWFQIAQNMFIKSPGWGRASRIVPAHNDVWV